MCYAGMYNGSFAVVDENTTATVPSAPGQIQAPKEQIPAHFVLRQVVEDGGCGGGKAAAQNINQIAGETIEQGMFK